MWYLRARLHVVPLVIMMLCRPAVAQVGSARLEGVVRDPSGAVVPGAVVSVLNTRTQIQAETSATIKGIFIFPSLQPGFYMLSVEAAGFRKIVVSDLELNAGGTVVQNVKLEIGDIKESIVVHAGAERAQTADAQIAQAVTLRDIEGLPQLGRAPLSLGIYSPGVQTKPGAPFISSSVNGTRQGSSNTRLDGIDVNDSLTPYFGFATTGFNTDSIEEFRIVTSGGKAEYGRNAGGQIELITRSGTNTWHGGAFEYLRNTALNANNFFNNSSLTPIARPKFIQNRFGVSVGGPIFRDRTFVFGNFQGLRTAQQLVRNRTVLTAEAKSGLFRWKTPGTGALQTFDILAADPRKKGIDPEVAKILAELPDPNNFDIGDGLDTAGYRFNNLATENQQDSYDDQFTLRADHSVWHDHRLFFRWTRRTNRNVDNVGPTDARYPGLPYGHANAWGWGFSFGSDWAISARLVNELRVGYKYYHLDLDRQARLQGPMLLADPNLFADPLDPTFSQQRKPPVRHITDNLTFVRSKHTIKVGAEGRFTNEWRWWDDGIWA
ncbi:MAG TPA: carboxypeptidase regulatory-like domain-containing protein, partial [Acidobacteriota bacterium]|nr:carboxypeptidase regulatory-like domain-containing protein [Acidobacteriota bacterium]